MHLYDYINEICEVSDKNTHNLNQAIDMFMNNVDDAGRPDDQHVYAGPENFDYAALKPNAKELRGEMSALKSVADLHDVEIQELHDAGNHDEAIALAKKCYDEVVAASAVAEGVDEAE